MNECKVLISSDGIGRMAIVRRSDGRLCLYERWLCSAEQQQRWNVSPIDGRGWADREFDSALLYDDRTQPLQGLFDTIEQAENEARSLPGFGQAVAWQGQLLAS